MTAAPDADRVADPEVGSPGSRRVFHGWKVVWSGAVILALQSALILQAFGGYAVILQERFGWSRTTISVAYSFNRAESGLLGPLHGWVLHRFGSKRVMRVGAVILALGFIWFSRIDTPFGFVASFFVIAIGAGLSGFLTVTTETVKWFERNRARGALGHVGRACGGWSRRTGGGVVAAHPRMARDGARYRAAVGRDPVRAGVAVWQHPRRARRAPRRDRPDAPARTCARLAALGGRGSRRCRWSPPDRQRSGAHPCVLAAGLRTRLGTAGGRLGDRPPLAVPHHRAGIQPAGRQLRGGGGAGR